MTLGSRCTLLTVLRTARLVALALGVALTAGACSSGDDAVDQTAGTELRFVQGDPKGTVIDPGEREQAPEISGETLDGKPLALTDFTGDVVLLNFWGSWCAPCRVETPELQELYAEHHTAGLRIVGVTVKDQKQNAEAFIRNKGIEFPSLWDSSGRVALAFRNLPASAIPSTILFDRAGRVAAAYTGVVEKDEIEPAVTKLLDEQ